MKTGLLFIVTVFLHASASAQNLEYRDKHIYLNDSIAFEVVEIKNGIPLQERDYVESDSSQYYDYMIVNRNNKQVLYLKSANSTDKSDAHFPNNFASHQVLLRNKMNAYSYGRITENNLTVLADNESYRTYLIEYLIEFGLLNVNGVNRYKIDEFRENHRN